MHFEIFVTVQISGEGAAVANVGIPATLFVTLKDSSGNTILPDGYSQEVGPSASLQLLEPDADSQPLLVNLVFSEDDQALIGQYTPESAGVYELQLTLGEDTAAGLIPPILRSKSWMTGCACRNILCLLCSIIWQGRQLNINLNENDIYSRLPVLFQGFLLYWLDLVLFRRQHRCSQGLTLVYMTGTSLCQSCREIAMA